MKKSGSDLGSTKRFGYEWNKYSNIIEDYEGQFLKWVYPLQPKDFKDKVVLDGGCGTGRNSFWPLKYGAKRVTAFDYNENTVAVAKRNLSEFKNATVLYDSLYDIKYKNEFDLAFSIGVIHHLADPRKAVSSLVNSVKKGGKVLIWVYGYEGNEWIVRYINPIRRITSKLPLSLANLFTYAFSIPLYAYVKLIPQKSKYLQQLSKFRFWHVHCITLDQLIPKIANYWTKKESLSLFENQGLSNIQAYRVNDNSWTVIGTKK